MIQCRTNQQMKANCNQMEVKLIASKPDQSGTHCEQTGVELTASKPGNPGKKLYLKIQLELQLKILTW